MNKNYAVKQTANDSDLLEALKAGSKNYHMSAYQVVQEPEIVKKNRARRNKTVTEVNTFTTKDQSIEYSQSVSQTSAKKRKVKRAKGRYPHSNKVKKIMEEY